MQILNSYYGYAISSILCLLISPCANWKVLQQREQWCFSRRISCFDSCVLLFNCSLWLYVPFSCCASVWVYGESSNIIRLFRLQKRTVRAVIFDQNNSQTCRCFFRNNIIFPSPSVKNLLLPSIKNLSHFNSRKEYSFVHRL